MLKRSATRNVDGLVDPRMRAALQTEVWRTEMSDVIAVA